MSITTHESGLNHSADSVTQENQLHVAGILLPSPLSPHSTVLLGKWPVLALLLSLCSNYFIYTVIHSTVIFELFFFFPSVPGTGFSARKVTEDGGYFHLFIYSFTYLFVNPK